MGFIGLGNMGLPMCENLLKSKQYDVIAFDKFDERVKLAETAGAEAASSVAEIAERSDIVFTMLFNTETTDEVRSAGGTI